MKNNNLGTWYHDGEHVVRQGEEGDCMYVVQQGRLEVIQQRGGQEVLLRTLEPGDLFGEMALFERQVRSATVRAAGDASVLTVDKRTLLRRIREDPMVAMHFLEVLSHRVRTLSDDYVELKNQYDQLHQQAGN